MTEHVLMKALEGEAAKSVKLAISAAIDRSNKEILESLSVNGVPFVEWTDRVLQSYLGAVAGTCITSGVVTKEMYMEKCSEIWDIVASAKPEGL